MSIQTVRRPCAICGATDAKVLWSGHEHEYEGTTDEDFDVVRCTECGLARLDPCPDVSELGTIYPPSYYSYHMVDARPEDGGRTIGDSIAARYHGKILVDALARGGRKTTGTVRLLDVGCGDGRILDYYRRADLGDPVETWGIDIAGEGLAVAERAGHRIVQGRFETDVELPSASFDVVVARHVIEHVEDPVAFVRRARALLAPGGVLILAAPDISGPDARWFKGHWGGNHFPRHWWFFDPHSLGRLAQQVGLELIVVQHEANPVFWTWTCHSALKARYPTARWVDATFPPVDVFFPGLRSLVLQTVFTAVDLGVRRWKGATGSMLVTLRIAR